MARFRWSLALAAVLISRGSLRADQFEAIEGKQLAAALKGADAKAVERLTISDLGAMPNLLKDARRRYWA